MDNISFSQISKYLTCPRSYKYYYKDKLRETSATAFLAFGSAMDAALNEMLADLKNNKSVTIDYKKAFDNQWNNVSINKKNYDLAFCTKVGYAKSDFVEELLKPTDIDLIQKACVKYGLDFKSPGKLHEELEERRSVRAQFGFEENEHAVLNYLNWLSMRRKAHLMLDAYVRDIIPMIEEVVDIQKKIEMVSSCGTKFIGFVDGVVRFKGDTENTVIDNKTSATWYDASKVTFSQQLATYCFKLQETKAAYCVMLKSIKLNKKKTCKSCGHDGTGKRHQKCDNTVNEKRCNGEWTEEVDPYAETQFVTGTIPQATQNMVMENAMEVLNAIKADVYPRNLNTCQNIYGNPCPYIKKCWAGKDDGLEKVL